MMENRFCCSKMINFIQIYVCFHLKWLQFQRFVNPSLWRRLKTLTRFWMTILGGKYWWQSEENWWMDKEYVNIVDLLEMMNFWPGTLWLCMWRPTPSTTLATLSMPLSTIIVVSGSKKKAGNQKDYGKWSKTLHLIRANAEFKFGVVRSYHLQ